MEILEIGLHKRAVEDDNRIGAQMGVKEECLTVMGWQQTSYVIKLHYVIDKLVKLLVKKQGTQEIVGKGLLAQTMAQEIVEITL